MLWMIAEAILMSTHNIGLMKILQKLSFNIGIKHGFLCINICWAPREMLKPKPERLRFQPLPRGPADVNVSEKHV